MSDPANNNTKEKSSSHSSQSSTVNSQIIDSIKEINELMKNQEGDLKTISNQIFTQAAGMAMLNIVNQQQQMYILQNTVTTVAAKAILESNPEEAVKMMNSVLENSNTTQSLKDLKDLMASMNE